MLQAFCSGLSVGSQDLPNEVCEHFARMILAGTYKATLRAASEAAASGGSFRVPLTRVGGGVSCNDERWIDDAIERAQRHAHAPNGSHSSRDCQCGRRASRRSWCSSSIVMCSSASSPSVSARSASQASRMP